MSATDNPRPMIPSLGRIYPAAADLGYLLLRLTAGLMLIPHVWPKIMAGPTAVAATIMTRRGVEPTLAAAWAAIIVEVLGAVCITLGLFTRAVALLLVVEFIIIVKVHVAGGGWPASTQGGEFPFIWLIVYLYILTRGGGPYSLDRALGREL
jgi:putative oxidoreductase